MAISGLFCISGNAGGDSYSLNETEMGAWYDGRKVYRKVVQRNIRICTSNTEARVSYLDFEQDVISLNATGLINVSMIIKAPMSFHGIDLFTVPLTAVYGNVTSLYLDSNDGSGNIRYNDIAVMAWLSPVNHEIIAQIGTYINSEFHVLVPDSVSLWDQFYIAGMIYDYIR